MSNLINRLKLWWYGRPFNSAEWCHDHCVKLPCEECEKIDQLWNRATVYSNPQFGPDIPGDVEGIHD